MKKLFKIHLLFVLNYTYKINFKSPKFNGQGYIATAKTTVSRQSTTPQQNDDVLPVPEFTFYVN